MKLTVINNDKLINSVSLEYQSEGCLIFHVEFNIVRWLELDGWSYGPDDNYEVYYNFDNGLESMSMRASIKFEEVGEGYNICAKAGKDYSTIVLYKPVDFTQDLILYYLGEPNGD